MSRHRKWLLPHSREHRPRTLKATGRWLIRRRRCRLAHSTGFAGRCCHRRSSARHSQPHQVHSIRHQLHTAAVECTRLHRTPEHQPPHTGLGRIPTAPLGSMWSHTRDDWQRSRHQLYTAAKPEGWWQRKGDQSKSGNSRNTVVRNTVCAEHLLLCPIIITLPLS